MHVVLLAFLSRAGYTVTAAAAGHIAVTGYAS
jgi:hypothetical protein